jgi:hypothetical protein
MPSREVSSEEPRRVRVLKKYSSAVEGEKLNIPDFKERLLRRMLSCKEPERTCPIVLICEFADRSEDNVMLQCSEPEDHEVLALFL